MDRRTFFKALAGAPVVAHVLPLPVRWHSYWAPIIGASASLGQVTQVGSWTITGPRNIISNVTIRTNADAERIATEHLARAIGTRSWLKLGTRETCTERSMP